MKKLNIILYIALLILSFSEKAFAEDVFENKTHLGLEVANLMLKGYVARDISKDFEIGLNLYSGALSSYSFKNTIYEDGSTGVRNVFYGKSVEVDLKQYINPENHNNFAQQYIKYFTGISFLDSKLYDPNVDGYMGHYYVGTGFGNTLHYDNLNLNLGADLGINVDTAYNAIAFTFFPRLSIGIETKF